MALEHLMDFKKIEIEVILMNMRYNEMFQIMEDLNNSTTFFQSMMKNPFKEIETPMDFNITEHKSSLI